MLVLYSLVIPFLLFRLFFGHSIPSVSMGWLSDRFNRVTMMMIGCVGTGIIAPFMLRIISLGKSVPAFFAQFTIGVVASLVAGPMTAWLAEAFPPHVRLTAGSLGYNIAICTSSGFSPLMATALAHRFGPVAPGVIYPLFAVLSIIGLIITKRYPRKETVGELQQLQDGRLPNEAIGTLL
jgi:MHS family proline/betaine transporter-like MFS transporter